MNLTFRGFCAQYLRELCRTDGASIRRFYSHVLTDAPQAAEVLWCYAAASEKTDYLAQLAAGSRWEEPWAQMDHELASSPSLETLLAGRSDRYGNAWCAYQAARDPAHLKRKAVGALRPKIRQVVTSSGKSLAALGREAGVTRAAVANWLAGDDTAVSPSTAEKLYEAATGDDSFRRYFEKG